MILNSAAYSAIRRRTQLPTRNTEHVTENAPKCISSLLYPLSLSLFPHTAGEGRGLLCGERERHRCSTGSNANEITRTTRCNERTKFLRGLCGLYNLHRFLRVFFAFLCLPFIAVCFYFCGLGGSDREQGTKWGEGQGMKRAMVDMFQWD